MSSMIVVPFDGLPLAEQVLPCAERLARATAGRLALVRAIHRFLVADELVSLAEGRLSHQVQASLAYKGIGPHLAGRVVECPLDFRRGSEIGDGTGLVERSSPAAGMAS